VHHLPPLPVAVDLVDLHSDVRRAERPPDRPRHSQQLNLRGVRSLQPFGQPGDDPVGVLPLTERGPAHHPPQPVPQRAVEESDHEDRDDQGFVALQLGPEEPAEDAQHENVDSEGDHQQRAVHEGAAEQQVDVDQVGTDQPDRDRARGDRHAHRQPP
jgi:hypothetical protein